jgi:hypothetical protein
MTWSFHLASAQSAGWVPSSLRVGKPMSASSSQPPGARLLGWGRGVSWLVRFGGGGGKTEGMGEGRRAYSRERRMNFGQSVRAPASMRP